MCVCVSTGVVTFLLRCVQEKKVIRSSKEEFKAAAEGAQGPVGSARAFLKARSQRVALDGSVGTVRVVKTDEVAKAGGYYCEVCECGLKDSVAYLDHINGKKRAFCSGGGMTWHASAD